MALNRFSLSSVFRFLEHPEYPSVGPHLRLLGITGLWHQNLVPRIARFKRALFYVTISYFLSQYIKCFIEFKATSLLLILQYAPFHIGIVKACFFHRDYKKWEKIVGYISSVERKQIDDGDRKINKIVSDYIVRSRRVTYFFWSLAMFTNFFFYSEPYRNKQSFGNGTGVYMKIFDDYTPYSDYPPGYYVSMLIQTLLGLIVSAYVVGWDTLICTIMIFFVGQLKITRLLCSRVIAPRDPERSSKNIAECHHFHTTIVVYQKLFNNVISPVMFIYLIVISINLGVCIIQIDQTKGDLLALISSCLYVLSYLIQLLLFYWHSNEVTEESVRVSYGNFESKWPGVDKKCQREVALLAITTSKRLIFTAGPFNEMSLKTFIAILRGSYSFYTLLSETN